MKIDRLPRRQSSLRPPGVATAPPSPAAIHSIGRTLLAEMWVERGRIKQEYPICMFSEYSFLVG